MYHHAEECDDDERGQKPRRDVVPLRQPCLQNREFAQENRERRRAGDGKTTEDERGARRGSAADQPPHRRDLARAHRQQRRASGEEAEGFGHRMTDDLLHGAVVRGRGAEADRRENDAHVLDGGKREQPLVVVAPAAAGTPQLPTEISPRTSAQVSA